MNWNNRVLSILERFQKRVITDECNPELGPLMIRYFLTPRKLPVCLYLHHFMRSDNDRHFHDHPWSFFTLILKGGYIEHQPDGNFRRHVGSLLFRPATHQHWVEIPKGRTSWSLVMRSKRTRVWGFWTEKGFVPWDSYDCRGG